MIILNGNINSHEKSIFHSFSGETGPLNAITDVTGVEVGHSTIISGRGKNVVGKGPVRTGVTAIFPREKKFSHRYCCY